MNAADSMVWPRVTRPMIDVAMQTEEATEKPTTKAGRAQNKGDVQQWQQKYEQRRVNSEARQQQQQSLSGTDSTFARCFRLPGDLL